MQKKIFLSVLVLVSIYVGLVLSGIYLYLKYEKSYLKNKLKIRNDAISLVNKTKKDKNIENVFNNFHFSYELKNIVPLSTNVSNSVIVYGKEEYWSLYETDKYGFFHNSNQSYIDPEIILLGDSFAKGCCVNIENIPSNILKKKGYKTLNLATGGGTLLEFATYLEYAKKYEKKLIILFFYEGNDYTDNFEEFNNKTLIKYFNNSNFSQNLINRQNEIDKKIKKKLKYFISKQNDYGFDISGIFSLKYLEIIYHKLKNKFLQNKIREIEVKRLEELFIKFNKVVKKSNSELIVVHIPLSTRFNKKENEELDDKKNELLKILEKNKIKFLDFTNYVKEKKLYEDIYRFDREILENINFYPIKKRHFNRRGYQELIAFILKNKD